ncbi:hypothetical protein HN587_01745 [Candidatus Woesearchaeota archaeon]|jgi:hypothetical protein|nr:hypothetical protein [Candidatus Woesearchaeota archaeon]
MAQELADLVEDIIGTNMQFYGGGSVTPLTAEKKASAFKKPRDADFKKEIYDSLQVVLDCIRTEGGISRSTYEANRFAINSVVRIVSDLYISSTAGGSHSCYGWDRESRNAAEAQATKFSDGNYGETVTGSHVNIFDTWKDKSKFEGTLFHLDYQDHMLQSMRILHQGHRNSLYVRTVSEDDSIKGIVSFVETYDPDPELPWTLTLSKEDYLAKISEFNSKAKGKAEIVLLGEEGSKFPVVKLYDSPENIRDAFFAHDLSIDFKSNECPWGLSIVPDDWELKTGCRLYVSDAMEDPNYYPHLAIEGFEFEGNTIIMPHERVGAEVSFVKHYVANLPNSD